MLSLLSLSPSAPARATAATSCPWGTVRVVDSVAAADYKVRRVSSRAAADCEIEWVTGPPGPGRWRETTGIADFTVVFVDGLADITVVER